LPLDRLAVLLRHFAQLNEPSQRGPAARDCPTIATYDDFDEIVLWGERHLDFLRGFSDFYHGVPCARWLRDLIASVS
jgi:hypothetical protein